MDGYIVPTWSIYVLNSPEEELLEPQLRHAPDSPNVVFSCDCTDRTHLDGRMLKWTDILMDGTRLDRWMLEWGDIIE